MKHTLLRTTIGGAICVAVLFALLLLATLAFDLLNRSSDRSVATGIALLAAIAAAVLALVYYGARRLLYASDDPRRSTANTHDIDAVSSGAICDELFAAHDAGDDRNAHAPRASRPLVFEDE